MLRAVKSPGASKTFSVEQFSFSLNRKNINEIWIFIKCIHSIQSLISVDSQLDIVMHNAKQVESDRERRLSDEMSRAEFTVTDCGTRNFPIEVTVHIQAY